MQRARWESSWGEEIQRDEEEGNSRSPVVEEAFSQVSDQLFQLLVWRRSHAQSHASTRRRELQTALILSISLQTLFTIWLRAHFNYFTCAYHIMTSYSAFSRSFKVDCLPGRRSQSFSDLSSLPFRSSWRHHRGWASLACLTSNEGCQGRDRLRMEKKVMSERCKLIRELELKWMECKWGGQWRAEQNRAE